MSYKIIYDRKKSHRLRFVILILAFFLLFLYCFGEEQRLDALEELALQLGTGENIGEAVAAFCKDVVDGR